MEFILIVFFVVSVMLYLSNKNASKESDNELAEGIAQKISESPLTKQLQAFLIAQYGELDCEEVHKLRQLAAGGGRGGCFLKVSNNGILFTFSDRKGEIVDRESILFDALGYSNLPDTGVRVLQKILLQTLASIPHLKVLDTGFFMYNYDRVKQSW